MHRIAIVDPNEASRESLRTMLLGVDFVWLEAECARYEYFFDVVQQSTPDLAIVALDGDKQRAQGLIGQLASEYPRMPMLTVSSDSQALLQSLQRGAKHFLTQPVTLEDLVGALRRSLNEVPTSGERTGLPVAATPKTAGQIVSVLGSRGGVGCTSIAVNLAATLAASPEHSVALIDLDLAMGDADIAIELPGTDNISMGDLARNIERLDMTYLRRALVKHPDTGLHVLRHPMEIHEIGGIHEGHVERILNLLRISYTHLVLDLSKALLPTDLMALRMSNLVLLVTQLELSALRNVVRLTHSLSLEGDLGDKIRVVVNRSGSELTDDGITVKKAEEVIGKPIFWQVPNDAKAMIGSRVAGQPLIRFAPKARAQQSLYGLAQALTGKAQSIPEPPRKKSWFGG
ncbi:MAG TPA: pilus assembly protein CpaE [Gemmataceae bacterium]|nr:pilus assembly protein CpaE [Gemmataceae bacterium]